MTRPLTPVLQPAVTVTSNDTRLAVRLLTVSEKANVCTVLLLTEPALTCAVVSYKPTRAAQWSSTTANHSLQVQWQPWRWLRQWRATLTANQLATTGKRLTYLLVSLP